LLDIEFYYFSLGLSATKLRLVANNVSVRDENRNMLCDVFTLNEIVKPNLSEVFILYFSQSS